MKASSGLSHPAYAASTLDKNHLMRTPAVVGRPSAGQRPLPQRGRLQQAAARQPQATAARSTGFARSRQATALSLVACCLIWGCSALPSTPWRVEPVFRMESSSTDQAAGFATLARQYEGEGRVEQALQMWTRAAQAAPSDAELHNSLGLALAEHGHFGDAVTALRRAVALAPERAPLLNNLAYALLLDDRLNDARAMFKLTLAVNPSHALALRNLAHVERRLAALGGMTPMLGETVVDTVAAAEAAPASAEAPLQRAQQAAQMPQAAQLGQQTPQAVPMPQPPQAQDLLPVQAPLRSPSRSADASADAGRAIAAVQSPVARNALQPSTAGVTPAAAGAGMAMLERTAVLRGVSIEVVNGNGMKGAAARTRSWLRERGVHADRLSNLVPYSSPQTLVLYRLGKAEQARYVAQRMPVIAAIAPAPEGNRVDLQVLLGHDLRRSTHCIGRVNCTLPEQLALGETTTAGHAANKLLRR